MILPALLQPPAAGPQVVMPAEPVVDRRSYGPSAAGPAGPRGAKKQKDPKKLAEELLPLILRRVREEREALGDLTDPFA